MRAIWKGALAFGLVNVPVKLYSATTDHDIRFHQVHEKDGGRLRYRRVCEICGEEVAYADIGKGYEDATGRKIRVEEEDFASLPKSVTTRAMEVLTFVPNSQIDPLLYEKAYYLEPEEQTVKPYALLRNALAAVDRTAIVKVAMRQKTQLACLRIRDNVMILQTLRWPDEVRIPDFPLLDKDVNVRPQELAMAESLIDTMSGDLDLDEYTDDYQVALAELIEQKLAGVPLPSVDEGPTPDAAPVVDLMAALRESVAKSQAKQAEDADEANDVPRAAGG